MPVSWSPLDPGVFGGGFMNGFMPTRCSSEHAPMTLGELAPGGDTDFAPVSHSMIDPGGAGATVLADLADELVDLRDAAGPVPGPDGPDRWVAAARALSAHCAPASSFDFTDVQLGL